MDASGHTRKDGQKTCLVGWRALINIGRPATTVVNVLLVLLSATDWMAKASFLKACSTHRVLTCFSSVLL
jgi:hypothetical protein